MGAKIARAPKRLGEHQNTLRRGICEQTLSMSACVIGSRRFQQKSLERILERLYSWLHDCAGIGRQKDGLAREVMALVGISLLKRLICWSELQATQWWPLLSVFLAVTKAIATGERCSSDAIVAGV